MDLEITIYKFKIWYVDPIKKLEELPNGNGGFVAFIVGLALYERLIRSKLQINNQESTEESIKSAMNIDLGITEGQRNVFWDLFRNGLLHQAMPKPGNTVYKFRDDFSNKPEFVESNGQWFIYINPWKFTYRVLNEFLSQPELIIASESCPLASIIYKTDDENSIIV